jgi:hypothetical protein
MMAVITPWRGTVDVKGHVTSSNESPSAITTAKASGFWRTATCQLT